MIYDTLALCFGPLPSIMLNAGPGPLPSYFHILSCSRCLLSPTLSLVYTRQAHIFCLAILYICLAMLYFWLIIPISQSSCKDYTWERVECLNTLLNNQTLPPCSSFLFTKVKQFLGTLLSESDAHEFPDTDIWEMYRIHCITHSLIGYPCMPVIHTSIRLYHSFIISLTCPCRTATNSNMTTIGNKNTFTPLDA